MLWLTTAEAVAPCRSLLVAPFSPSCYSTSHHSSPRLGLSRLVRNLGPFDQNYETLLITPSSSMPRGSALM
jgi:hypothetical protein